MLKNLVASLMARLLVVARQLMLVPLFLHVWGVDKYGEYVLLSAIPTVLAMSNLGIGTAAGTRVAVEIAGGRIADAARTYFAGLTVTFAIGTLLVGVAATMPGLWIGLGTRFHLLKHPELILTLLVISVASDLSNEVFRGVFTGVGRAATGMQIMNGYQTFRLGVMALTLWLQQSPLVVVAIDSFINVIATLFLFGPTIRYCPELYKHGFGFDQKVARELLKIGLGFQASSVWLAILFQGSLFLANAAMGAAGAATWSTLRAVGRSLNQLLSMVNQTVLPELQMAIAREEFDTARRLHGMAVSISAVIGLLASLPLAVAGPWVYHIWTRGQIDVPFSVWPIIGITGLLNSVWWTSVIVHRAMNRPWIMNVSGIIAAVVSVLTMYALATSMGIVGFAIGALVFEVAMAGLVLSTSLKMLDDTLPAMINRAKMDVVSRLFLLMAKMKMSPR